MLTFPGTLEQGHLIRFVGAYGRTSLQICKEINNQLIIPVPGTECSVLGAANSST
jgi:hypothetical protein